MIDAPLALAFSAGLIATVNPCGFAMLPAYLAYFIGLEDASGEADRRAGVARSLVVGASVSAGFLVVFAAAGALVTAGVRSVMEYVPWLAMVIGAGLVVLGVALLAGRDLTVSLPKLERGGGSRQLTSMFVFGVSYAVASLSCTLPVFLAVVASTLTRSSFVAGVATFVAYGLGMSLVLVTLTLALSLAKQSVVRHLRAALRHVDRAAGALLVIAGGYIVYYWVFNLTTEPGTTAGSGPARFVEALSANASNWINDVGAVLPLTLAGILAVAVAYVAVHRRRSPQEHEPDWDGCTAEPPVPAGAAPRPTDEQQ